MLYELPSIVELFSEVLPCTAHTTEQVGLYILHRTSLTMRWIAWQSAKLSLPARTGIQKGGMLLLHVARHQLLRLTYIHRGAENPE